MLSEATPRVAEAEAPLYKRQEATLAVINYLLSTIHLPSPTVPLNQ